MDMGRKPDPKSLTRKASAELRRLQAELDAIKQALAQPAPVQPVATTGDPFLQGVCVALQAVTGSGDGVLWREIVEAAGADDLFQYAAHIEPEEWKLAGFGFFAKSEMGRGKPKKLAPPALPAVPDAIHHTDLSEHPQYIEGWNDCRAEMLKGMK
jgi:hypothetical protein